VQPFDERPTIVVVSRAPPPLPGVGGGATSDAVMAALEVVSLVVHYKPRPKENCEPFKLKLKVPATKTVAALMKAFCKAVATSQRGYGLLLDPDDCFVTKMDAPPPALTGTATVDEKALRKWEDALTYVRPDALVGESFAHREEIRLVRRDDLPEPDVDTTNWATPRPTAFWISNMKDDGGI
jgi:hypothetical protein